MAATEPQSAIPGLMEALDYTPGRLDQTAPAFIWLQVDTGDITGFRGDEWPGSEEVTWQEESLGGLEIAYVRADLVEAASSGVDVLRIPAQPGLDPIIAYFEDYAPGRGRVTVACFGDAWTAAWGAMGVHSVRKFVCLVDPHYLAGAMQELTRTNKSRRQYTERIAAAVIAALRANGEGT